MTVPVLAWKSLNVHYSEEFALHLLKHCDCSLVLKLSKSH